MASKAQGAGKLNSRPRSVRRDRKETTRERESERESESPNVRVCLCVRVCVLVHVCVLPIKIQITNKHTRSGRRIEVFRPG